MTEVAKTVNVEVAGIEKDDSDALEAYAQEKYGTSWAEQAKVEMEQRACGVREGIINAKWTALTLEEKEALIP